MHNTTHRVKQHQPSTNMYAIICAAVVRVYVCVCVVCAHVSSYQLRKGKENQNFKRFNIPLKNTLLFHSLSPSTVLNTFVFIQTNCTHFHVRTIEQVQKFRFFTQSHRKASQSQPINSFISLVPRVVLEIRIIERKKPCD